MSRWGYNSVRLPLDASALLHEEPGIHFNEDSFQMLEDLIDLCEKYRVYAIFDLHGTPGHSGVACDNGLDDIPRLFLEPETRERMLILWEQITKRFKDRWIVGAYELLNEPLFPAWRDLKDQLASFYDDTIARIRKIDKNHMIILSGPLVGTDTSIFTRSFDPECENWAYTFHGYHILPDPAGFQKYLECSRKMNIPAWHGEGRAPLKGMASYYDMLAENHVGYNMFCWKSEGVSGMENSPVTHGMPKDWNKITTYLFDGGPRPSYAEAQKIFDEYLEKIRFVNCEVNTDMFRYSLRKPGIELPGVCYDSFGGEGISFSGGCAIGNPLNFRLIDRTKLVVGDGIELPVNFGPGRGPASDPMEILWLRLDAGDYACYSVRDIQDQCVVAVKLKADSGTVLSISCGEKEKEFPMPAGVSESRMLTLSTAEKAVVKLRVITGSACIIRVAFQV